MIIGQVFNEKAMLPILDLVKEYELNRDDICFIDSQKVCIYCVFLFIFTFTSFNLCQLIGFYI